MRKSREHDGYRIRVIAKIRKMDLRSRYCQRGLDLVHIRINGTHEDFRRQNRVTR